MDTLHLNTNQSSIYRIERNSARARDLAEREGLAEAMQQAGSQAQQPIVLTVPSRDRQRAEAFAFYPPTGKKPEGWLYLSCSLKLVALAVGQLGRELVKNYDSKKEGEQ
jgi:hypothetical protein